jgi:hypothetical protein
MATIYGSIRVEQDTVYLNDEPLILGKHYERYGSICVSIPETIRVPLEPGEGICNDPYPFFILGANSKYTKDEMLVLPCGPLFYVTSECTVTTSQKTDEQNLLEHLGRLIKKFKFKELLDNHLYRGYMLLHAMSFLNASARERLRLRWLFDWKNRACNTSYARYYTTEDKQTALILHALQAKNDIDQCAGRFPTLLEILCMARKRELTGWGDWFVSCQPEPAKYTCTLRYHATKHQVEMEFAAPKYRGRRVHVRITEMNGSVTDRVMLTDNTGGTQKWVLELVEPPPLGRGGRKPMHEQDSLQNWKKIGSEDTSMAMMRVFAWRRFWGVTPVRYVEIDPDNLNMLVCTEMECPIEWCYEILDKARFSVDKMNISGQIYAVRCLLANMNTRHRAYLRIIITDLNFRIELRTFTFRSLCSDWVSATRYWDEYCQICEAVEPEMALAYVESGLTNAENRLLEKLKQVMKMIYMARQPPYDVVLTRAIVRAIDAMSSITEYGRNVEPEMANGVEFECELETDNEQMLRELKQWARMNR